MKIIKKRKNKYNAISTNINGKTCDSKIEAEHYAILLLAEKHAKIWDLKFHPRYPLHCNNIKIGVCELDFEYKNDLGMHYIDVKGFYTDISKWKHKHFQAQYGYPVTIWTKSPS